MQREPIDLSGVVRSVNGTAPNAAGNVEVAAGGGAADVDITSAAANVALQIGHRAVFDYAATGAGSYFDVKIAANTGHKYRLELFGLSDELVAGGTLYFALNNAPDNVNIQALLYNSSSTTPEAVAVASTAGILLSDFRCQQAVLDISLIANRVFYAWKSTGQATDQQLTVEATGSGNWANTEITLGRLKFPSAQSGKGFVTRIA